MRSDTKPYPLKACGLPYLARFPSVASAVRWLIVYVGTMRCLCKRPCIVLDIDGTVLKNKDENGNRGTFCVPAFRSLVRVCNESNVEVHCITARVWDPSAERWTRRQLEACSITPVTQLYMRPKDADYSSYKELARESIRQDGKTVIASVGDQWADINGVLACDALPDNETFVGSLGDGLSVAIKLPSEFADRPRR